MISVIIICAYFGNLPGCYDTWLYSCKFNSTIDFLLITDQDVNNTPNHVHVIKMTFKEVQLLTDNTIGRHVSLDYPYKLCDLKPLYGVMFEKYLIGYDYWGHCDMDLVFGNIRGFLNKYHLENYDKFLDLGHLSLYRNTKENNQRFKDEGSKCGSWIDVITDINGYAFDERNGIYQIYLYNKYSQFDRRIYADIATIYRMQGGKQKLEDLDVH